MKTIISFIWIMIFIQKTEAQKTAHWYKSAHQGYYNLINQNPVFSHNISRDIHFAYVVDDVTQKITCVFFYDPTTGNKIIGYISTETYNEATGELFCFIDVDRTKCGFYMVILKINKKEGLIGSIETNSADSKSQIKYSEIQYMGDTPIKSKYEQF